MANAVARCLVAYPSVVSSCRSLSVCFFNHAHLYELRLAKVNVRRVLQATQFA